MATNDVQNQQLSDWLQLLGCLVELSPEDLQKLNTASMRSVWRHLERHVKPVSSVRTIKKNLLLAKLKSNSSLPSKFANFKIQSVKDMVELQKHLVSQEQINILKGKIRDIDEKLFFATSSLLTKISEKESMIHNLEELNEKSALLNLKLAYVQNDLGKLDKELEIVNYLKTSPETQMSSLKLKENKLLVAKFVQQFSSVDITDDCVDEMIVSTNEFPPSVIFDGILSVSNHALKSLNFFKTADIRLLASHSNRLNNLTDLDATLYKNEVELQMFSKKIVASKSDLDKEKAALCKIIEDAVTSGNIEGLTFVEFVDKLVEHILIIKKEEKLKELLDELQNTCASDFNHAMWMLNSCKEKEGAVLKEVNDKLSTIYKLNKQITTNQVSFVKAEVLHGIRSLVSNFLIQSKYHQDIENHCEVLVSKNLISKEIEMFQKLSLLVMTRKWEDNFETVPKTVRVDMLKAPKLYSFLCQLESKNLIKSLVEKSFWLHTMINHQQFIE